MIMNSTSIENLFELYIRLDSHERQQNVRYVGRTFFFYIVNTAGHFKKKLLN